MVEKLFPHIGFNVNAEHMAPIQFYDNNKTGSLMSKLTNDLMYIGETAHHGPEDLFWSKSFFRISVSMLMPSIWPQYVTTY
jgi:ABC-type multidrug transport system fused ATPase/permease subunit